METQELEHIDTSAKKTNSSNFGKGILKQQLGEEVTDISENEEIFEREKVEDSPFEIIGNEKLGYWISLGAFRLSEPELKSNCYNKINSKNWELIINVLCAIMAGKDMQEIEKQMKGENKNEA